MQESAGIERLDTAHLLYKNLNLEGREFHSQIMGEEIEVIRTDTNEVLHWGKVQVVPAQLGPDGESLMIVSRTEKFHLGERVNGYWVWNPIQPTTGGDDPVGGPTLINRDLVFNPIIDGKVCGNLNSVRTSEQDEEDEEIGFPLFLDPESMRTTAAKNVQGYGLTGSVSAINWPLSKCIHYLLQTLNAAEACVTNPTLATIAAACDDSGDLVINTQIPRGTYLAEALDMLLEPLGYRWKVVRTALGSRVYQFFNRTAGTAVWVRHQAIGSVYDSGLTNVEVSGITFDVSNLANQVDIVGGPYAYEVTVELARGWPTAQDNLDEVQLNKTDENFAATKDVWRRWVLNEAGDYIGVRSEIDGIFTDAFRAALQDEYGDTIWDEFVPRRRKFEPTLTLKSDGTPIGEHGSGIEIEVRNANYDAENPEQAPEWLPIGGWGVQVLEHECGIYFDGDMPPLAKWEELTGATREDMRLRVTATIVADKRLEARAVKQEDSPNPEVVPLLIDAPTKFRHQERSPLSKYHGTDRPSLEAIDTAAIGDFSERVREIWDLMDVGGPIQLDGLDAADDGTTYQVGQRVKGILGKNLSFEAKDDSEEYPQIVAIERNVMNQSMVLHLQRLKRQISFGGDLVRKDRLGGRGKRR